MKTNIFSATLRVLFVALLPIVFVENAWASTTTYYSRAGVKVASTGGGTVYVKSGTSVSSSSNDNSTTGTSVVYSANGSSTTQNAEVSFAILAVPNDDYRFDKWTLSGWSTNPSTSAASATGKVKCSSTSSSNPTTGTAEASFLKISISSVTPTSKTLNPTDARSTSTGATGTVTFSTTNDNASGQIGTPAFSDKSGSGTWEASNSWTAGTSTVTYTFKGNGYYGGSGTSSGSRNNSATLTLPTAKGTSSKSVTFTANFPSLVLSAGSSVKVYPASPTTTANGTATFPVQYCDGAFDFTAAISGPSGGTWTKGDISVSITDAATGSGTVTVPFTFNAGGTTGDFSATLTLTPVANTGGTAQSVTITAYAEPEAVNEASVTPAGGSATEYATFAQALTAANGLTGSKLTLLKNIDLGTIAATQEVKKAMTIELNGKTLKATVASAIPLLTLSQNVTVTIQDSKSGGMIYNTGEINGVVYGVTVNKGTLNVTSGTIKAENTQQYFYGTSDVGGTATNKTSVGARGIQQAAATTVNISGSANIQGYASRNAYGIREEGSKANSTTLNITGGNIYAEAASYAYGVYGLGKVNISGTTTITSQLNTNPVNGNETYVAAKWDSYTLHRYGYGVCVSASAANKATECYFATLTITGGTINSYNANSTFNGTSIQSEHTYGVYLGAGAAIKKTNTAPDGTLTQKASAIGHISNATIHVVHEGYLAYGVLVEGSYNSFDNTESVLDITNCNIDVTSYTSAYGVYANATVGTSSSNYGGCYAGKVLMTNNNVTTTTTTGSTSVALLATGTMTTIKTATSATYAGEYESSAYIYVKSGNYTANSETSYATAAITGPWTTSNPQRGAFKTNFAVDGSLGGNKESMSGMYIQGGTFKANAKTTNARGVWNSGTVVIAGGTFEANATTTNAYGIYSNRGVVQATNATLKATAGTGTAYGVFSDAMINDYVGWKYAADNTLTNCNITAKTTSGNTAYGVYINGTTRTISSVNSSYTSIGDVVLGGYAVVGNASIKGCTITATSAGTTAGGIYRLNTQVSADKRDIAQGEFTAIGNTITATTNGGATGYGIRSGGPSTIKDNNITVTTSTTGSNGIIVGDGEHTISGNTVTAKGTGTVYGIQTYSAVNSTTGYKFQANATLENNTVTATTTSSNTAYAVYATTADAVDVTTAGFAGTYVAAGGVVINSGKYTATSAGTTAYAITLDATKTKNGVSGSATCTVNGGKFKATGSSPFAEVNASAAVGNLVLAGGYYVNNTNLTNYAADGYAVTALTSGEVYNEGYRYQINDNSGAIVCKVYQNTTLKKSCQSVEEALQYAQQNSSLTLTLVIVENCVLSAGDHILPSNATLLVPYKDGQTSIDTHPTRVYNSYTTPSSYRKLTLAAGAHLDVLGKIQTGGRQEAQGQMDGKNGCPHEKYGWIYLHEGSSITLESGSHLYAWGYVTGPGEIDAKRGSTVYESFQIKDWRGGTCTSQWSGQNKGGAFPITQFYIQNIESPVKFRPGSAEKCDGTVNASSAARTFNDVKFIGLTNSGSFFEMDDEDMSEDTWVRKWYDAVNDKQVYDVNSAAKMNSISLSLYGYSFSSSDYVLPVTNNMKIHLLTGSLQITQNTELLPGAEIEVDKEATVYINSGKSLYVFDIDEWMHLNGTANVHTYPLPYSPSWNVPTTCPRAKKVTTDASLNIHGKLQVNGKLYTTAGGANIFSTNEDAGTITYGTAAPSGTTTVYVNNTTTASNKTGKTANPAWLQNEDGTHEETSGTASGKSWIYYNGKWNCWEERNCFGYDAQDHPYAKPRAWVQLTSNVADANHLYHDAATGNRAFIVEDGCLWWEVEPTPYDGNKYKCVDPDYDGRYKYYEYVSNKWQEAKVTITWKNGSTTLATYTNALYGVRPTYLSANPYKAANTTEYYTWIGWNKGSENGEFFAKDAELPIATENTTYYAKFETHKYQYTITFKNSAADGGQIIDAPLVTAGEHPVCSVTPTKTATTAEIYTFSNWSGYAPGAELPAVTGTAEYTAVYTATPRPYTIIFQNYDGEILQNTEVGYGSTPSYVGATPYRSKDAFYSYTFNGWEPAITSVTGNKTYTAKYTSTTRGYTIKFLNYDGTVLETKDVPRDQTPEYTGDAFSKPSDAENDYSFSGWEPELATVTEDATYTAQFIGHPKNVGAYLDIVDWTSLNEVVINMTHYVPTKRHTWKISINGNNYTSANLQTDHTLKINLSGMGLTAGSYLPITVLGIKDATPRTDSHHSYRVPHIFNADATLSGTDAASIVYVREGTLTVNSNITVGEIYVAPGAELKINSGKTLTVKKYLVLRTEAFLPARLTNNGTLTIDDGAQMYYSRIVRDNKNYYQLGFPFDVILSNVKLSLSNNKVATFGSNFGLMTYNSSARAENGAGAGNWVNQKPSDISKIDKHKGYQLLSASPYYYELYFPVSYSNPRSSVKSVSVTAYSGGAEAADQGWNYIVSPYTDLYNGNQGPGGIRICELTENNRDFYQRIADYIYPAQPFYYQAEQTGSLQFASDGLKKNMPRRAPESEIGGSATTEIEWLRLHYGLSDNNKNIKPTRTFMEGFAVEDQTNIFLHPDLFTPGYDEEYEGAKWSVEGERPFIYTSLTCGNLAFAALPDSTELIPVTVFNPTQGEMRFALADNDFMNRIGELWLIDTETGEETNLLQSDYTYYSLETGTQKGRFFLKPVIRNIDVATEINNKDAKGINNENGVDPKKVMINGHLYIIMPNGDIYSATGKKIVTW